MSRSERISNQQKLRASAAAELYRDASDNSGAIEPNYLVEREKLYSERESKRNYKAIIVLATERRIGKDQSNEIWPNENAKKCGVPVGRLYEIGDENEPKGFGTGFLIAPNILITNNHVFRSASETFNCAVNFSYEKDKYTQSISNGTNFRLKSDVFFYTCEDLDFTLVYVQEVSIQGNVTLSTLGTLSLIGAKGKIKFRSAINIIQYPGGGIKKYTTEDNYVTAIDDQKGIVFYTTDTETGSSGSPCFNEYWEVAALHYTAVPSTNAEKQWLCADGSIWNPAMGEDKVHWIANAGTSISKIIDHLKSGVFNENDRKYINLILNKSGDPLLKKAEESKKNSPESTTINTENMKNMVFNFYGPTTLYINQDDTLKMQPDNAFKNFQNAESLLEKKERFDEDYTSRLGYLEEFIPGFTVPVPRVTDLREKELYKQFGATVPYQVPYIHFSLVMNKKRRMLMWAASNVDYSDALRDSRSRTELGNGAWRLDNRIPAKYQIQASEFYDPATLVDKGHIVRRDDNCWADLKNKEKDLLGIEYANADTFHWTNCTPQHEAFNRDMHPYDGIGLWGILENAIKKQLEFPKNDPDNSNKDYGQRACVLAGPILNEDDPEYMDIQYPVKFWKIFAIRSASEGNLVYGFILSQEDKVNEAGLEKEARPRFDPKVIAMQVSLKEIEKQSGVLFDDVLHEFDVKGEDNSIVELHEDLHNFKAKR